MIHPVILCGGAGTRLWPASRRDYPKQFAPMVGDESLYQTTLRRLTAPGLASPLIVARQDFRFHAAAQAAAAGIAPAAILLEPDGRNTAPAVLVAALHLEASGQGNELMLVAPSDHAMTRPEVFLDALPRAAAAASEGALVTFGIVPDAPETGYGWLELDGDSDQFDARTMAGERDALPLRAFVEKPDAARAAAMLAGGRHLWNSGMFLFRVDTVIEAFAAHAPDMLSPGRAALAQIKNDLGFLRLGPDAWDDMPDGSIDYAIMEKADNLKAVPVDCGWSDLGAWEAVRQAMVPDEQGVSIEGPVLAQDCRDTLLRSDGPQLVGIGLDGLAVVATRDAVLVMPLDRANDLRKAVADLQALGVEAATAFPHSHRPWGSYDVLAKGTRYQVKQITVAPGQKLSLQSHVHRAEHWIVVAGTARITVDENVQLVSENESVYVPLGAVHRLENPGKVDLHLIEVQTGAYLGEDDILRYADDWGRGSEVSPTHAGRLQKSL